MDSPALITIDNYVSGYILKKELTQDSYFSYLKNACDCVRVINTRHSNRTITAKVSVSSLGVVEMPSDMIGGGFLAVPINGKFWTFTVQSRKVNTTTTTNGIEGQSESAGEGVDIQDDQYLGIGGRGGVNAYYVTTDWKARRLFCDGFKSDTAVLRYTSSGLELGAETYIPVQYELVLDAYLDLKRAENRDAALSKIQDLRQEYKNQLMELRIATFMPSLDEIKDAWDSSSSLGVIR